MSIESGKLFSFYNVGLFSDHFLSKRLPAESPYWTSEKATAQAAFNKIFSQYKKFISTYKQPNEAQTEADFIRPVLGLLGYPYIVQTPLKHKGKFNQPDYSLFADEKTKKEAGSLKVKEQEAFYSKALAICDAKYWGRPLDIKLTDKRDTFTNINPSFQIINYLVGANVDWGILTNGKLWRLYYQKASSRSSNFYEVDLEDLLLKADLSAFLYLFLFFRKEAFIKDSHGKSFLDQILEGSTHYATELSDLLKEKVFEEIFPHLARGFLHYRKTGGGIQTETEETLKEIYNGALTLLYRLLFILYAEDRDLLPVKEKAYRRYSLANIKEKVAGLRDKKVTLSELSTDLWSALDTLVRIIDVGDTTLNVPTYNGGLFSQKNPKNDFLKANKVPDPWLAEALDHLTREIDKESGKPQFIDYSELEVRHLGSIYEGLLEFHLKIADEDKAVVKEKGREIYKSLAAVKSPKEVVKKGELYLANDKHERKSSGSYYTPDYIVKYIVQNAVDPVLQEKLKQVEKLFSEVESLRAKAHRASAAKRILTQELNAKKQQGTDELFSLKVLDPAMGSGHFLVETVDYLSDHIIKFLNEHAENPVLEEIENLRSTILSDLKKKGIQIDEQKLTPTNLVKRMVMKRCIYGVDLNPMAVELAKLSLWLHSFTLGAPLSFLDHHLKCGNSLIGTTVETVKGGMEEVKVGEEGRYVDWEGREKVVPEQKAMYLFGSQFAGLLSATELMRQVGELTDSTFEEVQESQEKYEKAADALKPFKLILDLWISEYFGNKDAQRFLTRGGDVEAFLKDNTRLPDKVKILRENTEAISQHKHFFHWELEFPEVFYEGAREKENPGFDVVIGNPPYGMTTDMEAKKFYRTFMDTAEGRDDTYKLFTEQAYNVARHQGLISYITPNTILTNQFDAKLRRLLLSKTAFINITTFNFDVFADPTVHACVFTCQRETPPNGHEVYTLPSIPSPGALKDCQGQRAKQSDYETDVHALINISSQGTSLMIFGKIQSIGLPLGTFAYIRQCIKTGNDSLYLKKFDASPGKPWKPVLGGSDVDRYGMDWPGLYLKYGPWLARNWQNPTFFEQPKIMVRETSERITATVDRDNFYLLSTLYSVYPKDADQIPEKLDYLLTLLNSNLAQFFMRELIFSLTAGAFTKARGNHYARLPIRRINFTTPEKERPRLLEKGKKLYEQCLAKNDFFCVTSFVDHCLKQKPEQADVVHDLLAFLADRMMEMNKEKQVETKGFLEWLEANIGVKVDSLKNKTKINAYHEGGLEDLLEILKENRKVLKINPANKEFFDPLKDAFEKSLAKLPPLKTKLATTDRLIDLIVYQLYGLSEEEIKIVEGDQNR